MSLTLYPYFVDPARLRAVYGGKDATLAAQVRAGISWPPTAGEAVSAEEALDQIIRGAVLDSAARDVYTSVLESICGVVGVDGTESLNEDDLQAFEPELVERANAALARLGGAGLDALVTKDHPYLPGIGRPDDIPLIDLYEATDCARVTAAIAARWTDFAAAEALAVGPLLRLLERRRFYDALIVFSY